MKKFLALLFVCAGMTAMAGVPQVNKADFQSVKGQKVMKANTLSHELSAPAMQSQNMLTPRQVMKQHNMTLGDNLVTRKAAPRRLSNTDVINANHLDFRYVYTFDDNGELVWDGYHFRGSEGVYWQESNGQLYCAGIYWSQYTGSTWYLPVDIDYTTHEVVLPSGMLLDDDTLEGTYNSQTRLKVDTVNYSILVDLNWYTGASEEFTDITGTIYDDGTIEFNDSIPYVFAGYQAILKYSRSGNPMSGYRYTLQSSDTTFFTEVYQGTQFIVPNAVHEYDMNQDGTITANTENAYMFQYDDTTAVVFNLYGMGMPAMEMNIYPDGTMKFPLDWPVSEMSPGARAYYANYYGSAYNWDNARWYWLAADDDETLEATEDTVKIGTVEPTAIKWGAVEYVLTGIVRVSDNANMSLSSYPFVNNVLRFTDDSQFVLTPPTPEIVRGDVNNDGSVNISDVTVLINHLLSGDYDDADNFSSDNSDCNEDGSINIGDVTTLINYLLKGAW